MSGNFVTVESRPHPAIGYDPCPGSVEGSIGLADQMRGFHEHTGELAAFLEGARNDIAHWAGDNQRAFQEAMVELPPKLHQISSAFETSQAAVRGWAEELSGFQERSLALDEALRSARESEATADSNRQYFLDNREGIGWTEQEDIDRIQELDGAYDAARDARQAVERQIGDLEDEYRDRARHYGAIINGAGDQVWSASWWDTIKSHIDDFGDWLEDSFIGDIARALAPIADWVSEVAGWISAGALGLALIALPIFPPASVVLTAVSSVAGHISTAGDVTLALSGYGDWSFVPMSVLTFGLGKGISHATRKIVNARKDANARVITINGKEYAPSVFTVDEFVDGELVWRSVRYKGEQVSWALTGYGLSRSFVGPGDAQPVPQNFEGYEDVNPWDLPPNVAYLTDKDGELVK